MRHRSTKWSPTKLSPAISRGSFCAALSKTPAISLNERYGIFGRGRADHSALMLAARITLPHFSASSSSRLP